MLPKHPHPSTGTIGNPIVQRLSATILAVTRTSANWSLEEVTIPQSVRVSTFQVLNSPSICTPRNSVRSSVWCFIRSFVLLGCLLEVLWGFFWGDYREEETLTKRSFAWSFARSSVRDIVKSLWLFMLEFCWKFW